MGRGNREAWSVGKWKSIMNSNPVDNKTVLPPTEDGEGTPASRGKPREQGPVPGDCSKTFERENPLGISGSF